MSDDTDLIRKMLVAWFRNEKSDNFENLMELCRDDMARVLAVVRAHDVGLSPTNEEAAASAADARRFRWLMNCHSYSMRVLPPYKFAHGINWSVGGQEDNIRAEIDTKIKEQGDD